jgi:hypothetical protein
MPAISDMARRGKLDPVIGRDDEIRRVIQVLLRRTKNNPVLIGEPGVGKTAIVEGLTQRIVCADVPEPLKSKRLVALDLGAMVAGTKYRGEFEDRLKALLREIEDSQGQIITFIDELHTLVRGRGGRRNRRLQHIKAGAGARGVANHRRYHHERVPQVHRERPSARTPLPDYLRGRTQRGGHHRDPPRLQERYEPKPKKDPVREERIRNEAIVDAYGPEEQALGWYYYLENQIRFSSHGPLHHIQGSVAAPKRRSGRSPKLGA